jgi:DNA polymerase III gamma/tau subunit
MVITNRDHTLLVEKYRPTTLEGYVGNENIKRTIAQYLDQNDIQNSNILWTRRNRKNYSC